jgi:hypothetical protein
MIFIPMEFKQNIEEPTSPSVPTPFQKIGTVSPAFNPMISGSPDILILPSSSLPAESLLHRNKYLHHESMNDIYLSDSEVKFNSKKSKNRSETCSLSSRNSDDEDEENEFLTLSQTSLPLTPFRHQVCLILYFNLLQSNDIGWGPRRIFEIFR